MEKIFEAFFYQSNSREANFDISSVTTENISEEQIRVWISWHLQKHYHFQWLQGKPVFNLKEPARVDVKLNNKTLHRYITKRIPESKAATIIKAIEHGYQTGGVVPFIMKHSYYILEDIRGNGKRDSYKTPVVKPKPVNISATINTIEYRALLGMRKNATPILYTGITN